MRVVYLEDNVVVQAIIANEVDGNGIAVDDTVSIGMTYDSDLKKFFDESPFASWIKDSNVDTDRGEWVPPVAKPEPDSDGDTTQWTWDEDTTSWVAL